MTITFECGSFDFPPGGIKGELVTSISGKCAIAHPTILNGKVGVVNYSAFQIDELHRHNQNPIGTLYNKNEFHVPFALRPTLWSTHMKTTVSRFLLLPNPDCSPPEILEY